MIYHDLPKKNILIILNLNKTDWFCSKNGDLTDNNRQETQEFWQSTTTTGGKLRNVSSDRPWNSQGDTAGP